jgi:hypothetical protein
MSGGHEKSVPVSGRIHPSIAGRDRIPPNDFFSSVAPFSKHMSDMSWEFNAPKFHEFGAQDDDEANQEAWFGMWRHMHLWSVGAP